MNRRIFGVLAGISLLSQAACTGLLDVQLPGKVTTETLNNPLNANVITNGVVLDFECAWSNYVTATNALSDQMINGSQQGVSQVWYTRNILENDAALLTNCEGATGLFPYATLQIARNDANRAMTMLDGFADASVPTKPLLKATVKVYGAYATLALGEGFCQAVLTTGKVEQPTAALTAAEAAFSEALTLAQAANSTDLTNMARVGRARARLDLANYTGAAADAALVPLGYTKLATRGAGERQRWNLQFEFQNNVSSQNGRMGSVADNWRAVKFSGVADPRVTVSSNGFAQDGITPFYQHTKALSRSDGVLIASYKESQMVLAEVAARAGDLTTARSIINARHTAAGLPAYDPSNTATAAEVIAQIIEERGREMFLEGGHRLNDMLRFRSTAYKIPFRGEAGSIHPTGLDHRGLTYGPTTCIPIPYNEK